MFTSHTAPCLSSVSLNSAMQSYTPQQAEGLGRVQRALVPKTEQNVSNHIFISVKSPESMNHVLFPLK